MTTDPPKRRRTTAWVLSGLFPGLGQFYNREPIKGGLFFVAGVVLNWLVLRALPTDLETLVTQGPNALASPAVVLLLAVWLWSIVDARRVAGRPVTPRTGPCT